MSPYANPSLGQYLIARGLLSEDQLRIALQEQGTSQFPLGKQLVELGFVSESVLRDTLSESLGKQCVDLSRTIADPEAIALVPEALARRHRILPLRWEADTHRLTIASANIDDIVALDRLRAHLPASTQVESLIAGENEITQAIDQSYGFELSLEGILNELETGEFDPRSISTHEDYHQPIVRLIDAIMGDAVKRDASDIHFEPEASFLRIRYRLDGLLRQIRVLHRSCWPAMAVRIKVLAGLNIAETRAPQDGRISLSVSGRPVDFRVSSHPSLYGENIVMRILDRKKGILPLEDLGLPSGQLDLLRLMIARPQGMILFTGPTGSGKTTTLYSILSHINDDGIHIMTLEDPVEYPMNRIRQSAISEASKLDFANGIRSMMRQDPDVILVGEIRDKETAEMAFRAAMTGHQVYSTLHTNSAIGAIPRLSDIGILPDILAGNLIGVVGQRLIRRLCPHCSRARPARAFELKLLKHSEHEAPPQLHEAVGCPQCEYQGYKGRMAIMELLRVDAEIDELIVRRASYREIQRAAQARGFTSLAEDGLRRVLAGQTSIDELVRVVDLTERMLQAAQAT